MTYSPMRVSWLCAIVVALSLASAAAIGQAPSGDGSASETRAERRVALLIGNGAYPTSPLKNPANDARAMARTLRALGFDVLEHIDLNQRDMKLAVTDFGRRLRTSDVGLFFFAGHGMQVGGRNYLLPVDAAPTSEDEVEADSLDLSSVLARMATAKNRLNIVILDACRDNPFARSFRSTARGLAMVDAPTGTLIAYATAPGAVALDGEGGNGVYTAALLKALPTPGLRVEDAFKLVRQTVRQATNGGQVPWESSSIEGQFMFAGSPAAAPRVAAAPSTVETQVEWRQAPGALAITARVPDVEVWLADQKIGTASPTSTIVVSNVPAGKHRLTARKIGHRQWEREVEVAAGQRNDVVIDITPLGPDSVGTADDGADMVLVPAGEFWMGTDDTTAREEERPRHRVYLDAFHIDRYEVTNARFERFIKATGRRELLYEYTSPDRANHPAGHVIWQAAAAYCQWAGKRLPTEAEWEKAARGTDERRYPWGNEWDPSRANSREGNLGKTAPVGAYPTGVSPYGAHDMAGNVIEWTADRHDGRYYLMSPERNPVGPPTGYQRVLRGGAFDNSADQLRTTWRIGLNPTALSPDWGFRCARSATSSP